MLEYNNFFSFYENNSNIFLKQFFVHSYNYYNSNIILYYNIMNDLITLRTEIYTRKEKTSQGYKEKKINELHIKFESIFGDLVVPGIGQGIHNMFEKLGFKYTKDFDYGRNEKVFTGYTYEIPEGFALDDLFQMLCGKTLLQMYSTLQFNRQLVCIHKGRTFWSINKDRIKHFRGTKKRSNAEDQTEIITDATAKYWVELIHPNDEVLEDAWKHLDLGYVPENDKQARNDGYVFGF